MTFNKSTRIILGIIAIFFAVGAMFLVNTAMLAQAGPELPNRATPTPIKKDKGPDEPVGAYIELAGAEVSAGAWTVVQWQDSNSDWQNVEGWQGTATSSGLRWWVHPKDFGSGPFRWVVQTGPGGTVTAVSEPFHLPTFPNNTLQVTVN